MKLDSEMCWLFVQKPLRLASYTVASQTMTLRTERLNVLAWGGDSDDTLFISIKQAEAIKQKREQTNATACNRIHSSWVEMYSISKDAHCFGIAQTAFGGCAVIKFRSKVGQVSVTLVLCKRRQICGKTSYCAGIASKKTTTYSKYFFIICLLIFLRSV